MYEFIYLLTVRLWGTLLKLQIFEPPRNASFHFHHKDCCNKYIVLALKPIQWITGGKPPSSYYSDSAKFSIQNSLIIDTNILKERCLLIMVYIERFHVTSSPSRLQRKTENSRHVGVQRDRSFYVWQSSRN